MEFGLFGRRQTLETLAQRFAGQGERVGAVGATGWATGPHLHFEFKLHGAQQNPMAMARSSEAIELSATGKQRFAGIAQSIRGQLDAAGSIGGSVAE